MKKFALCCILVTALSSLASPAYAKCGYKFSGQLLLEHDGIALPLRGVKVRVKRKKGTGAGRHSVSTDRNGRFSGTWKFDKDHNGALPGSNSILFDVQMQLNNGDNFRVKKGGTAPKPWDTFAEVRGKNCIQFILKKTTLDSQSTANNYLGNRAYVYWIYDQLHTRFVRENIGFKGKLSAVYPSQHIYTAIKDNSWFVHKAHIKEGDWDDRVTLIHEAMHKWDVEKIRGEINYSCLFGAHHKSPNKLFSNRCTGFVEGFAQATALRINNDVYNGGNPDPENHKDMRSGTAYPFAIRNLDEAQRTDDGWRNFIEFMFEKDEWHVFDKSDLPAKTCSPRDITVYDLLRVLKAVKPAKEDINILEGKATFRWFTDIFEDYGFFSEKDARFYQLLGDPSLSAKDILAEMCTSNLNDTVTNIPGAPNASLLHPNGKVYFFRKNNYYRFDPKANKIDKVGVIGKDGWTGLKGPFDAALVAPNGKAYFFKGRYYYRYDFDKKRVTPRRKIGVNGWKGLPQNIDAALMHSNGKAYFFKSGKYYRYDFGKKRVTGSGLSTGIDGWRGLKTKPPSSAVLHQNGKAYFFKGPWYYRFDFEKDEVDKRGRTGFDGWRGL